MGKQNQIFIRRYCDEPMARMKGLIGKKHTNLPRCQKDCKNCMACIEVDMDGDRQHVSIKRG